MPFCAPQIVYSNSWLSQSSAISNSTIFTPAATGLYRVTVTVQVAANAGASPNVSADLSITDTVGQNRDLSAGGTSTPSTGGSGSNRFEFVLSSSTPVPLSTTLGTFSGTPSYNVFVVIEQLQ